jgi:hypothetical protein
MFTDRPTPAHRYVLVLFMIAINAVPAFADSRLVRVIWDVGRATVYARIEPNTVAGSGAFVVPANDAEAKAALFYKYEDYKRLRKGDRVRLYVVNYNPVAHVWHDSSVVEQILPDASLVGAILNATLAGISGVKAFPAAGVLPSGAPTAEADPCSILNAPLMELAVAAKEVHAAAVGAVGAAATTGLAADSKKLARVPVQSLFWQQFDNATAWTLIRTNSTIYGSAFPEKHKPVSDAIDIVNAKIGAAARNLTTFDLALEATIEAAPGASCEAFSKQRDLLKAFVGDLTSADSPLGQVMALYKNASELWAGYERKIGSTNWADDAIEVIVKDPIKPEAVLRLDAVFASPEKTFTARTQRHLVLQVEQFMPILAISSGLGYNEFRFKTLQTVQVPAAPDATGKVAVKSTLQIVDDAKWNKLIPVWTENLRLLRLGKVGAYFTFGTTPDRNIFNNVIAGLSILVPRWRTSFTYGRIWAKGLEESDLQPVVTQFTDPTTGFAFDGTAVATLPIPQPKWKRSNYGSITFVLVSF